MPNKRGGNRMGKEMGKRISDMLKKQNMTQKSLSERLCISEAVLSRYVAGEREPKPEMLANIATALRTTSDYLLGIENDEFDYPRVRRIIARNSSSMTEQEKKELINALFGEE